MSSLSFVAVASTVAEILNLNLPTCRLFKIHFWKLNQIVSWHLHAPLFPLDGHIYSHTVSLHHQSVPTRVYNLILIDCINFEDHMFNLIMWTLFWYFHDRFYKTIVEMINSLLIIVMQHCSKSMNYSRINPSILFKLFCILMRLKYVIRLDHMLVFINLVSLWTTHHFINTDFQF